jgi:hypothetical protein
MPSTIADFRISIVPSCRRYKGPGELDRARTMRFVAKLFCILRPIHAIEPLGRQPRWHHYRVLVRQQLRRAGGGADARRLLALLGLLWAQPALAQSPNGILQIPAGTWTSGLPSWLNSPPPPPPSPPSAATLTLTVNPQMPSIPENSPIGTVVATLTATWSDGSPFTGALMFGTGYGDDGGTFALSCTQCSRANLLISPAGKGVLGDGGTVQRVTVVATQ